jgi:glycosyltransferase involved in cell wall biosynthesis
MSRIHIINPLRMQWEQGYEKSLNGHTVIWTTAPEPLGCDLRIYMWCDDATIEDLNRPFNDVKKVVFIRRYEYYHSPLDTVDWQKISKVIMVNDFLAWGFQERTGVQPHVIFNAVQLDSWTWKERLPGKKIAWVGFINQKKNLPLAIQIMAKLPRDYELHVAGGIQDVTTMDYIVHLANSLGVRATFYDQVKHEYMDAWLEDKNYLLNTSISEGCPNSVIEAMAKGIQPVVHEWPGAREQFGACTFQTIDEAVEMITCGQYTSGWNREVVKAKFGPGNYQRFRQLVDEVLSK